MAHNLTCGCCGTGFRGTQDFEHDTGYGTCSACQEWIDRHNETEWKDLEGKVAAALNDENRARFLTMEAELRRGIILELMDRGAIRFAIGGGLKDNRRTEGGTMYLTQEHLNNRFWDRDNLQFTRILKKLVDNDILSPKNLDWLAVEMGLTGSGLKELLDRVSHAHANNLDDCREELGIPRFSPIPQQKDQPSRSGQCDCSSCREARARREGVPHKKSVVVLNGNLADGFEAIGPFTNMTDAQMHDWLDCNCEEWWVLPLLDPETYPNK